ncbi:hypothetical protein MBAV_006332 [Candidatus Magnetobacterium bavaricum]|uniref:Uncharacterized protein n=1 Tax=Candidatus Magnetobacterium bavaricum TaxID=29290 RepID=A0A0F3GLB6_9BACT|nr:hypothetical protein MBAV_006332 [Candidatus Magnetobacterium bavaricum]
MYHPLPLLATLKLSYPLEIRKNLFFLMVKYDCPDRQAVLFLHFYMVSYNERYVYHIY